MLSASYWFWLCFARWVSHWVCSVQRDESRRENVSQSGEAHPPLITWDKVCPILTYQQPLCFSSIPYQSLFACVSLLAPFLLWIIFNFPAHLGSRSLCGRVVRDEAAVSTFLLEFSLTACRPVYCIYCLESLASLYGTWLYRERTSSAQFLSPVPVFFLTSTTSILHTGTSLSTYTL